MRSVSSGFMKVVEASHYFKFKSNVDEGNSVKSISLREAEIQLNAKLECVPKFCYLVGFPPTWKVRESQGKSGNLSGQGKSGKSQGILD